MPERVAFILALCAPLLMTHAASSANGRLSPLDAIVQQGMAEQRYPGAVLIVGHRGKQVWRKAYGRHTYEPGSPPVRLNTLFDLASLTKVAATAPAALLLAEDGRLDLSERVAKYLPEFAANGKEGVTLTDLLTHVSGLKAYESWAVVDKHRAPDLDPARALRGHCAGLPASYAPGTRVVYSCLNMQVLAGVVEAAASQPMEQLLRARLWGPLGMRDTTFRPTEQQLARCAPSFTDAKGLPARGIVHDPLARYHGAGAACPGNAGLFSTATDLAAYAEAILNNGRHRGVQVLKPESIGRMLTWLTPAGLHPARSLGWAVYREPPWQPGPRPPDRSTIGHTGYTGTWLWIDHLTHTYIVFLSNRTYPSPKAGGGEGGSIDATRERICATVVDALELHRTNAESGEIITP